LKPSIRSIQITLVSMDQCSSYIPLWNHTAIQIKVNKFLLKTQYCWCFFSLC